MDGGARRPPIFVPEAATVASTRLTDFTRFCADASGQTLRDFAALERFSVEEFRLFWRLFLEWSALKREGDPEPVCLGDRCESATFFPNLRLGYAENLLEPPGARDDMPAVTALSSKERSVVTRGELRRQVRTAAASLRRLGLAPGDRVVAIARNGLEAVVAALTTTAVGAVFSSCSPEMGAFAVLSRFAPLAPRALLGHLRSAPHDAGVVVAESLVEIARGLPSLSFVVALDDGPVPTGLTVPLHRFGELVEPTAVPAAAPWQRFPFNHPLFVLFSSGTTGAPKCIVHGAGGTLIEHLKEHRLHCDLRAGDKLFFQTSCAWMMWHWQLSALATGAEIVLYDGPVAPETLWRIAAEERVTHLGTSPAYLQLCADAGFAPDRLFDFARLRGILSTGSILYDHLFLWVHEHVTAVAPLQSISGGTDIIGCFVLGNPNLPVHIGEAQCRSLRLDVRALPAPNRPDEAVGELVCANPFPSRPLGFFDDSDGSRFHGAYFSQNPGMWTHGDLIEFTSSGGARLHGRSDGVLKIRGVRIGPAEIYRILQDVPEIAEAMAVEQRDAEIAGGARLVLLVVLRPGLPLEGALVARIRRELAERGSAAHVPDVVVQMTELPTTHSNKRSEAAARDAINGRPVRNSEALRNPDCLDALTGHPALARRPAHREHLDDHSGSPEARLTAILLGRAAPATDPQSPAVHGAAAPPSAAALRRRTAARVAPAAAPRSPIATAAARSAREGWYRSARALRSPHPGTNGMIRSCCRRCCSKSAMPPR
jgi:acetoacetyl-CoA synthetase